VLETDYDLRGYQREALDAWRDSGDRGVVELPTGSGKTVVAIGAICTPSRPRCVQNRGSDSIDVQNRRRTE
jgi:superfamily II DNA or RNA helicase